MVISCYSSYSTHFPSFSTHFQYFYTFIIILFNIQHNARYYTILSFLFILQVSSIVPAYSTLYVILLIFCHIFPLFNILRIFVQYIIIIIYCVYMFNILYLYLLSNVCSHFAGRSLDIGCASKIASKQALKQTLKHMFLCYIPISYRPLKTYHFMPLIHIFYTPKTYGFTLIFYIFLSLNEYVFCIVLYSLYCLLDNTLNVFCYLVKYSSYYFCRFMISHTKIFLYTLRNGCISF